jgi:hypothetical protein
VARHQFSDREREIIALKAIRSSIDELVNRSMLMFSEDINQMEVGFPTRHHQQLFSALLTDFLEPVSLLNQQPENSLELLEGICRRPQFDEDGFIEFLEEPTIKFRRWLDTEITVESWFPAIDRQVELRLARAEFVMICGAISKHSLGRLTRTARRLSEIFRRHELEVSELDALLALDDFYDRFHDDVLNYHASVIAEMLNNIRWGMWHYLRSTFLKAFSQRPGEMEYNYRYPEGIEHEFSRSCFWDLMNDMRSEPYLPQFHASDFLRGRF